MIHLCVLPITTLNIKGKWVRVPKTVVTCLCIKSNFCRQGELILAVSMNCVECRGKVYNEQQLKIECVLYVMPVVLHLLFPPFFRSHTTWHGQRPSWATLPAELEVTPWYVLSAVFCLPGTTK